MYIYTSLAEELNTHSLQLWLQWGKAQPYKSFHSYITMETTNPPPALFVYFFLQFKKKK